MWRRIAQLSALVAPLALLLAPGARATYPGTDGKIAFELRVSDATGTAQFDGLSVLPAANSANCAPVPGDAAGALSCDLGAPSYSPDGKTIVVARQLYQAGMNGGSASLMLVGADGSGVRILPRQTADDEHPAFLPHAAKIVFEGRRNGAVNLFTVGTDGTNLRQLTTGGGASPAPCANGTIAFVKHANVYLLSANQRSERRLTVSGGREPDCAPNSTRIVFTDRSSNVRTIATTGKQLQVLRRAGPGSVFLSSPVYSPDGSLVAYKSSTEGSDGGGSTDLVVRKLNGSLICQLPGIESQPGSGTYGEGQSSLDASTLTWQPLPGARGHRVLCSSFAAQ